MAPLVQVPTNFGRHHIGSRTHSNLLLNLKNGTTTRANSLILAFNSPVIESLVATLDITSLDMQDFEGPAVDCFVDCAYTGEIERVDKHVFREVKKMAKVFDVSWLGARCVGYFNGLVEEMKNESYEEMLFLFEEGAYSFTALKERDLLNLAIEKIGSVKSNKTMFIETYMEEYNSCSLTKLDLVLELAGCDVQIVVQSLTNQLARHISVEGAVMTETCKHLLNTADLGLCRRNNKVAYENLFDVLQGIKNVDVRWTFDLYRNSNQESTTSICKLEDNIPPSTKISNLFHSFDKYENLLSIDALVDRLAEDAEVKSLLMFAEALWHWIVASYMKDHNAQVVSCSSDLLLKIVAIKQKRGWSTIPRECFNLWKRTGNKAGFFDKWMACEALFCSSESQRVFQIIKCLNPVQLTTQQFCRAETKLVFHYKHPDIKSCSREGNCGFMIKTTPPTRENPDLFDIYLCTDHSEYPADVHLHDEVVRAENMHFLLEHKAETYVGVPISWANKPVYDSAEIWRWGWYCIDMKSTSNCSISVLYNV